jgi:hypothetical protein
MAYIGQLRGMTASDARRRSVELLEQLDAGEYYKQTRRSETPLFCACAAPPVKAPATTPGEAVKTALPTFLFRALYLFSAMYDIMPYKRGSQPAQGNLVRRSFKEPQSMVQCISKER